MLFQALMPALPGEAAPILINPVQPKQSGAIQVPGGLVDQPITIRLADCDGHRNAARLLLNRMYSWRGYGDQHVIATSPSHTTFTASSDDGEVLGTITLATDSQRGLAADALFKDVIDTYRARPGAKVCELTKFAFDMAKQSKAVMASLFHLIFIYGHRQYGCTDLFIEVNPRHVRFYETMLGFTRLGDLKMNASVDAPSQLMWLSVAEVRDRIDRHAGTGDRGIARSLYPHFFSPREEDGLYARMISTRQNAPAPEKLRRVWRDRQRIWPLSRSRSASSAKRGTGEVSSQV